MIKRRIYDIIVVGGGFAGAAFAGVMARAGYGVLVVERESRFRDRVRGEFLWPWGVQEARALGLDAALVQAGRIELHETHVFLDQQRRRTEPVEAVPMMSYSHPSLQETFLSWASAGGAIVRRPAKAVGFAMHGVPQVHVETDGQLEEYTAQLIVGADGKRSGVRRWTGGMTESDPEHHRFGGVLVTGVRGEWRCLADASTPAMGCLWFNQSTIATRIYARMTSHQVSVTRADCDFAGFITAVSVHMPPGTLDRIEQAGPLAMFPNNSVWSSRIAGNHVVLIGDAAGAADPTWGRGTSLVLRDVRDLSERLLTERNWEHAVTEYADHRARAYDVIRAYDRWTTLHAAEDGPEAERRRERRAWAKERDPTLGGFKLIELRGPDGLVADEAARRHYFGDDLL